MTALCDTHFVGWEHQGFGLNRICSQTCTSWAETRSACKEYRRIPSPTVQLSKQCARVSRSLESCTPVLAGIIRVPDRSGRHPGDAVHPPPLSHTRGESPSCEACMGLKVATLKKRIYRERPPTYIYIMQNILVLDRVFHFQGVPYSSMMSCTEVMHLTTSL